MWGAGRKIWKFRAWCVNFLRKRTSLENIWGYLFWASPAGILQGQRALQGLLHSFWGTVFFGGDGTEMLQAQ